MLKKALPVTLVMFLVLGLSVFSGCRRHSPQKRAEFVVDYVTEALDLTQSQQEQLNQIKDELIDQGRQMHSDKAMYRDEIVAQLRSEEIDQERLKSLVGKHRARMDELMNLMIPRLADFHQTLTPEQKTKLVNKIEKFDKCHSHSWE